MGGVAPSGSKARQLKERQTKQEEQWAKQEEQWEQLRKIILGEPI
jgi:hypothetical protein